MFLAAISAGSAQSDDRSWTVTGEGVQIVAADCSDCDEDIGITISCKGPGQPAEVIVPWAAVDLGRENAKRPVNLSIDGRDFTFESTTLYVGLLGYVPQFFLSPGDPVLEALQAGSSLKVIYRSRTVTIGLAGSRTALESFKEGCGWQE